MIFLDLVLFGVILIAIQSETELYKPIKSFFENLGYAVKGEVNSCDMVAIREGEDEPVIIELKKSFNLPLLFQGMERLRLSTHIYLAVEYIHKQKRAPHQKWTQVQQLCERLGFGLIAVQFYKTKKPHVEILCVPMSSERVSTLKTGTGKARNSKKKTARLIGEFHERSGDYNLGGSRQQKLVTSYRELALNCTHLLKLHGALSPKQLVELTGKKKVPSLLQKNYYGWFERVERGIYRISPAGTEALKNYSSIVASISEINT